MMQTRRSSRALNEDRERKEDTVVEEASPRTKTKKARRALVSSWKSKAGYWHGIRFQKHFVCNANTFFQLKNSSIAGWCFEQQGAECIRKGWRQKNSIAGYWEATFATIAKGFFHQWRDRKPKSSKRGWHKNGISAGNTAKFRSKESSGFWHQPDNKKW